MSSARANACAVQLSDGRVLITGGTDLSGPVVTADIYDAGGNASPAAPMLSAHSGHVCAALPGGRVLVAGGVNSAQAEIYTPATNSWSAAGLMTSTRQDAAATVLGDGRVVVSGGMSSGAAIPTIEVYNPTTGMFQSVGPTMSSPRKNHAAVALKDGRVMIAGGSNRTISLASVDIFDPSSGTVSPGGTLQTARAGLSATLLGNGYVLVAGGNDGSQDLASAEIYDPITGTSLPAGNMSVPRRGHLAFLLPNNGSVLLAGGTSAGAATAVADLYIPWQSKFVATGSMGTPRAQAAGGPGGAIGSLLVAGGSNASSAALSSAENYAFATIKTDKPDYQPGDTVTITGSGWKPGESVTLTIEELPDLDNDSPIQLTPVTADSNGNITSTQFVVNTADLNVRFTLTAVGQVSGLTAQAEFTDSTQLHAVSVIGAQTPDPVTAGSSASYGTTAATSVKVDFTGNGTCTVALSATGLPAGASASFNPSSLTGTSTASQNSLLTISTTAATPGGTYTITVQAQGTGGTGNDCKSTDIKTATATLHAAAAVSTTTAVTSTANPSVFGQSVTFNATITPASGSAPSCGTVDFKDGGTTFASGVAVSGGGASTSTSALSVGSHSITAVYTPAASSCAFAGSTSPALTQTVNARATSTSVSLSPTSAVVNQSSQVTVTVTDTAGAGTASTPGGTITLGGETGDSFSGTCTLAQTVVGTARCQVDVTPSQVGDGTHTITASYAANDSIHANSGPSTADLTVNKRATSTGVSFNVNAVVVGQSTTATVTVTDTEANGTKSSPGVGTVVSVASDSGDTITGTCTLAASASDASQCTVTVTPVSAAVSPHHITATFAATAVHLGSNNSPGASLTVNKRATSTAVSFSANPVVVGQSTTATVTVTDTEANGTKSSPGVGTVVSVASDSGDTITGTCTLAASASDASQCTVTVTPVSAAVSPHHITATFAATAVHLGSDNSPGASLTVTTRHTTTTVSPVSPVVVGQDSTVTVRVTDDEAVGTKAFPTGTVTIDLVVNVTFTGVCTLSSTATAGVSQCQVTANASAAATYTITAHFAATAVHSTSVGSGSLVVNKRATLTAVSLGAASLNEGQSTGVTVTVTDIDVGTQSVPVGTVTLSAPGNISFGTVLCAPLGTNALSCAFTLNALDNGGAPDSITATYVPGDTIHKGSFGLTSITISNVAPTITTITGPIAPIAIGGSATVSVNFTDPGTLDTHPCSIDWHDATTSAGTVTEVGGSGSCSGSHTYSGAGVYEVIVTVTDKDGGSATRSFQYVVIYDPSAGFVTGGGWINSPVGAYTANPSLAGKANFGFVSKYEKGKTVPSGQTEFQFQVANFNFHSTSYDWLVISGGKAQYKGSGTVNGTGDYMFILSAIDGSLTGGDKLDKFRIKIVDKTTDAVVYDNQLYAPDTADPATVLGGGSIVVHSK